MSFEAVRQLADAVLLEGYVLYPYRVTSKKNQFRWSFGVVAPRAWSEAGGCEPWWLEADCLIEAERACQLAGCVRFMQAQSRRLERLDAATGEFTPAASLEVGGTLHVPWDEGEVRECEFYSHLRTEAPLPERVVPLDVAGGRDVEELRDERDALRGRVLRERSQIHGRIVINAQPVGPRLIRLRVRVENVTEGIAPGAKRDEALPSSFIATHLLLSVSGGQFISLLDPPEWAAAEAKACRNVRTFPVLAGPRGSREVMLAAPIILYDHAQLAPESPGDFFDATEIDEMLRLRTALLTDEERREARATDPRAAALIDAVDLLPPERIQSLHGALRDLQKGEMIPRIAAPAPGSRVRLRPGKRRTDAQDLLFEGQPATVEKVEVDVDGRTLLAVTIDGDPAAELHRWYGRFQYYGLDEVEPL